MAAVLLPAMLSASLLVLLRAHPSHPFECYTDVSAWLTKQANVLAVTKAGHTWLPCLPPARTQLCFPTSAQAADVLAAVHASLWCRKLQCCATAMQASSPPAQVNCRCCRWCMWLRLLQPAAARHVRAGLVVKRDRLAVGLHQMRWAAFEV